MGEGAKGQSCQASRRLQVPPPCCCGDLAACERFCSATETFSPQCIMWMWFGAFPGAFGLGESTAPAQGNQSHPGGNVHGMQELPRGWGRHFLLQGIFPTQGLKPGLWRCKQILY